MTAAEFDRAALATLERITADVAQLRASLYARRAGCACSTERLCAQHAAVLDNLGEVGYWLTLAARDLATPDV